MTPIKSYILAVLILSSSFLVTRAEWTEDFKAAKQQAKEEGKYLLLDFTGSDWCHWCIKLEDEVFSQATFKTYAEEHLILVELDFPNKKKQKTEIATQNRALAKHYKVEGFPTILVLNPEGDLVERTGYRAGGADAYIKHIQSIIASDQP